MRSVTQRIIAFVIGLPAAVVVIANVGLLVTEYQRASVRAPADESRIEALLAAAREDHEQSTVLAEEYERQTQVSLSLRDRQERWAWILIGSAVVFLVAAKWLVSLHPRLPRVRLVVEGEGDGGRGRNHGPAVQDRATRPQDHATPRATNDGPGSSCSCSGGEEVDLSYVGQCVGDLGRGKEAVIPILQAIQSHYRYLPDAALERVCELTEITPAQVTGVSTFYTQFRRQPVGEHIIRVCHGTACHVAGAERITDEIRRCLGLGPGEDTDRQGLFTIEPVACLGCCTLSPVAQIDGVTYGNLTSDKVPEMLNDFLTVSRNGSRGTVAGGLNRDGNGFGEIRVGLGSCCVAGGSSKVYEAVERTVAVTGARAVVKRVGCVGMCHQTPLVEAVVPGRPSSFYARVSAADARSIVLRHFKPEGLGRRVRAGVSGMLDNLWSKGDREPLSRHAIDVRDPPVAAFLGRQQHIATEHCGHLDPTDLDEYLEHDGFKALEQCVKLRTPEEVIGEVQRSGLRGRGGAGYPTGEKWARVRQAGGGKKYVICNGDEGDPGAFMDRMLMESYPYRIIEGMAIAAYAVGATEGRFYIRAEYPLAVRRIREALQRCEERGFLGDDILGSGFTLQVGIMQGAGAFVCGEETALLASMAGERGMPTLRPPFPAESGLDGQPTLMNNVETYATVPWIVRNGTDAFAKMGTRSSKGTKVFSLAGKVKRGGLIEVEMGMTIGEIVEDIGGGTKSGRPFKAVQIGGPSGGCVPAELADTPVDYEALTEVGAIMGSGGLVVLDESDCMVDIARYFLAFTQDQSCGKCTYCRIGTRAMLDVLDRLCEGRGRQRDLDRLEELATAVASGSLCGLGKTAPNPVLTTLGYFRSEYEAHLDKRCPAGKCKTLIRYHVTDACTGCTLCAQRCPAGAIEPRPYDRHGIDDEVCTRCDICREKCPEEAIEIGSRAD